MTPARRGVVPSCHVRMESLLKSFGAYLEAEMRASRNTTDAYLRDLRQFAEWRGGTLWPCATNDVREWIGHTADGGASPTTLRRKTQSLRAFYRWGMRLGHFISNPAADVLLAKRRKRLPEFIREEELDKMLDADHDAFEAERAHIAVSMLYSLGLRQAELLAMNDTDINMSMMEVRVRGKRNKERVLPLPPELATEIRHWQEVRDRRYPDLESPAPLLAGAHGRMSKTTLYRVVTGALAGVKAGRKSPHMLRHSFATAMVNDGADLDAVRELLGHESLATTQIYTHLSFSELLDNYRGSHPRGMADGEKEN